MEGQEVTRLATHVKWVLAQVIRSGEFRWFLPVFVFLVIRTRHLFTREPFHQMLLLLLVGHADACAMGYTAHQLAYAAMATKQSTPSSSAPRMPGTWTK